MYTRKELQAKALSMEQIEAVDIVKSLVEEEQQEATSQEMWDVLEKIRSKIIALCDQTRIAELNKFESEEELVQETLDRR